LNLTVEKISKRYGTLWAVQEFSADFTEGVYGLIGPNGSGKTTLMRMIVDILRPTAGRVLYGGRDISVLDERYRDILGYLPQHFGLYRNFTAEHFLLYMAALKGLAREQARRKTGEVLELVNLAYARKQKLGTFSGGMKQKLGIAQALLNDPRVLILDEPTAGLDPKERIRFRNLISEIAGERIVILSTHIVSDVEYAAGEVIFMKEGRLLQQGQPSDLLKELEGLVWKAVIREEELSRIKENYRVGNIARANGSLEVRFISPVRPFFDVVPLSPGLEDLYLYHFDEEPEKLEAEVK
jgi:ABC-2 type transport system ATP-binding protein